MRPPKKPWRVAVVGAGIAGAACATSLSRAGAEVVVFDKARGVGGRMATRRCAGPVGEGGPRMIEFDHGAQHFAARHPRFRAAIARAESAGVVAAWSPRIHTAYPGLARVDSFVPAPGMSALCRHLLIDVAVRCEQQVQRMHCDRSGWQLVMATGAVAGPYDHVMLAMPPRQAAMLLEGHHECWAEELASVRMEPCWSLMAVTDDVDWPWDAAEPEHGPLAWIMRNDRKPGRSTPLGLATWVAHATPEWSSPRLELLDPRGVADELQRALADELGTDVFLLWHHCIVHRWRYAVPTRAIADGAASWWDEESGLGVCGDFLGSGTVEAAWRSGDELADTVAAWLDARSELAAAA